MQSDWVCLLLHYQIFCSLCVFLAPNSFGPVAFWAFRDLIPLRTTKIIADRAPVSLRDKNGATLLHHTIHLFHRLNPSDQNGHRWASLILLTLLNRGVDIAVRDCWGRTARDLCQSGCQKALCASLKHTMATNVDDNPEEYRDFEETVSFWFTNYPMLLGVSHISDCSVCVF